MKLIGKNFVSLVVGIMAFMLLSAPFFAEASVVPRPIGNENRIKIINYMPNSVYRFTGHYFYQSIIEFSLEETIETISMGSPSPWQIVPAGNRIFLKPVDDDASTNMTVITDKRMYFFEMHASDALGVGDDELNFIVKFVYPEDNNYNAIKQIESNRAPNLKNVRALDSYNFDYSISGNAKDIEPLQVFDDGEFTYFKFKDINAELPAIFLVDSQGREALVNYRIAGEFLSIERVAGRFTLRSGPDTICVYNEKEIKRQRSK